MKKDMRIAINGLVDSINWIDEIIQNTAYNESTTLIVKKAIDTMRVTYQK